MDPIDRIAEVFAADCRNDISKLHHIIKVVDTSRSFDQAINRLTRQGVYTPSMEERLASLEYEVQQLDFCLRSMSEVKSFARKALLLNFLEGEKFLTFNQEVCFSYACKFISSIGPRLAHFSNAASISKNDVQRAEIKLAKTSPCLFTGPDLYCYETI